MWAHVSLWSSLVISVVFLIVSLCFANCAVRCWVLLGPFWARVGAYPAHTLRIAPGSSKRQNRLFLYTNRRILGVLCFSMRKCKQTKTLQKATKNFKKLQTTTQNYRKIQNIQKKHSVAEPSLAGALHGCDAYSRKINTPPRDTRAKP